MINGPAEDGYRTMINSFRISDLQVLLEAFNQSKSGQKSELQNRAIELLRKRPLGFNYQAYVAKIVEINYFMKNDQRQQQQTMSINIPQPRMYERAPPSYPQQSMYISRAGLPQAMPQIQRVVYSNNIPGNIQYQQVGPSSIVPHFPTNQQVNAVVSFNHRNTNTFTPSIQSIANISFKKLPFYEVVSNVLKPTILVGHDNLSLPPGFQNTGMKEASFKIRLCCEQINYISLNQNILTNEYIYQLQIRICGLEPTSTEITDFLPLALNIRINNKICELPPFVANRKPGTEVRRMGLPIHCSQLLKLNPVISNIITINWTPDSQTYVMAVYIVKKLSSDTLLQQICDRKPKSTQETRDVIKRFIDSDNDLTTTSFLFSLICPLGLTKMTLPVKSVKCNHFQCFDGTAFILMNEKKPTWLCPICSKPCLFDDLQIQNYFLEVVMTSSVPESCNVIEILADGTWKPYEEKKEVMVEIPDFNLTLSDEVEDLSKDKYEQNNEANTQSANTVQPATTAVDLRSHAQVQPQQAITSSEQGLVIEIDSD